MEDVASQFRRCGYKYVKMDFMTHGRMEADHWYDKSINTGTEAYNYGMQPAKDALSQNITNTPFLPSLVRSEHRKKVRRYYTK